MLPDFSIDWTSLALVHPLDRRPEADGDRDEHGRERRAVARARRADRSAARLRRGHRGQGAARLRADRRLDAGGRALGQRVEAARARRRSPCFRRFRPSSAIRCPSEMIYAYHKAIADGVGLPLIAFQFPKAFGPDFPPDTLARLATIPEIDRAEGSVVRHAEDGRDDRRGAGAAAQARHHDRQRHVHLRGDGHGLRRRADRLRQHGDRAARSTCSGAWPRRTSPARRRIWERLGPLARYAWRAPIRDYRPRMKEVLKMQGLIAHADGAAAAARRRRCRARGASPPGRVCRIARRRVSGVAETGSSPHGFRAETSR